MVNPFKNNISFKHESRKCSKILICSMVYKGKVINFLNGIFFYTNEDDRKRAEKKNALIILYFLQIIHRCVNNISD